MVEHFFNCHKFVKMAELFSLETFHAWVMNVFISNIIPASALDAKIDLKTFSTIMLIFWGGLR